MLFVASLFVLWPISIMVEEGFDIDLSGFFSGRGVRFIGGVPYFSGGFHPTPINYLTALGPDRFPRLIINSSAIAILSIAVALSAGIPAGYALARFKFKGRRAVATLLLVLRTVSPFAIVFPLYLLYTSNGLWDTYIGVSLAYLAINVPVSVWMLRGLFAEVPSEVYEAAELSGASDWQIFRRIAMPLVIPGIVATAIFVFVLVWNEFLMANLLTGPQAKTVSVGIWSGVGEQFGSFRVVNWDELNAIGTLAFIPAIFFLVLVRRYLGRAFSLSTAR